MAVQGWRRPSCTGTCNLTRQKVTSVEIPAAGFDQPSALGYLPLGPCKICFLAAAPLRIVQGTAAAPVFLSVGPRAAKLQAEGRPAPMRLKLGAFSRYRPRALTLVLLAAIVAAVWLANLTADYRTRKMDDEDPPPRPNCRLSVEEPSEADQRGVGTRTCPMAGRCFGASMSSSSPWARARSSWRRNYSPRLAGNLGIWLVMLAAPASACEWLLRRYRPRWRSASARC